jgi:hypothetical protein
MSIVRFAASHAAISAAFVIVSGSSWMLRQRNWKGFDIQNDIISTINGMLRGFFVAIF